MVSVLAIHVAERTDSKIIPTTERTIEKIHLEQFPENSPLVLYPYSYDDFP